MTRADAINILNEFVNHFNHLIVDNITIGLDKETAQDDIDAFNMAIKTLEQEPCDDELDFVQPHKKIPVNIEIKPCDDCISRQAVLDQTYLWSKDEFLRVTNPFDYLRKRINSLPSVNPTSNVSIQITEREKYGRFN